MDGFFGLVIISLLLTIIAWAAQWRLSIVAQEPRHGLAASGLMILGVLGLPLAFCLYFFGFAVNSRRLFGLGFIVAATGLTALMTGIVHAARSGDSD
jgi:hypothetical protein